MILLIIKKFLQKRIYQKHYFNKFLSFFTFSRYDLRYILLLLQEISSHSLYIPQFSLYNSN